MNEAMALDHPIIAIDGYSSCGKSTIAKALARSLGIRYIDSGAMYRAVTFYFLENNIPFPQAGQHLDFDYGPVLDKIHITFQVNSDTGLSDIYLNNRNIFKEIRSMEVSDNVSHVSAIKEVRHRMVHLQKQMKQDGGLVMDGRDIGTTVFPEADLKIFMTADPEVRAIRRFKELQMTGVEVTLEDVRKNINSRDYEDTHREESPLRMAEDAFELDNTYLNHKEQVELVLEKLKKLAVAGKS
ncbi:MAG TPA: (d)CMP kinase [Bacteroidia bacterium]|nr:(d)CMP kinase [Bacteroidia bacterium]